MTELSSFSSAFWAELLRAAGTKPNEISSILGGSGIEHTFIAAGIDSARRRLVVVSSEKDARTAALSLADLQATFRAVQIVLVRENLTGEDGQADRALGQAAISASEWAKQEIAEIESNDLVRTRNALAQRHILQYFFPPPDQVALGLIERTRFTTIPQVIDQLVRAPDLGHPFGPTELVEEFDSFTDMIQALAGLGLLVIESSGLSITDAGRASRDVIRPRTREAVVDKLLNRMNASQRFQPIWLPVIRRQDI